MKKRAFKNLSLNKKSISNLKETNVKGGTSGLPCLSIDFIASICFDYCKER